MASPGYPAAATMIMKYFCNKYFQDEDARTRVTTPKPVLLGFTTTRRPFNASPRVKTDLRHRANNRPTPNPLSRPSPPPEDDRRSFISNDIVEDVTEDPVVNPFDNPPFITVDGKKPRVKANLNTKFAHGNNKQNKFEKQNKKQGSKKVELDRSQFHNINFVSPTLAPDAGGPIHDIEDVPAAAGGGPRFRGPEVRPDGRTPRVKSNVLAAARDQGQQQQAAGVTPTSPSQPRQHTFVTSPAAATPRPRPPPSRLGHNELDDSFNEIDDSHTQSVSPSTIRNIFPDAEVTVRTPEPIFSSTFRPSFDVSPAVPGPSSFRPFSADPPRFEILSATPRNVPRLPTSTFSPPPPPITKKPKRPIPSRFANLGPPPQPFIPPELKAKLPPPPTRPLPPRAQVPPRTQLQQDRKRFGARPRVKADELAQKANAGNGRQQQIRLNNIGESPRSSVGSQVSPAPLNTDEILPGIITTRPTTQRPRPRPSRPKFNVRFRTPNDIVNTDPCKNNPFKCPPRKSADGRKPRVKSNIKAARRNYWNPRRGRVIKKQRKQGKLNAALWNRGIIRRGRKQNLSQDTSNAIDNTIDEDPITTPDPISSLKQIVASKENSKSFRAFPAARSFQNKRLRSKQKINHRPRGPSRLAITDPRPTTPLSVERFETTSASTTVRTVFSTPAPSQSSLVSQGNLSPLSVLPASRPTQSAPETAPFTQPDMGLFVTNPRALPEQLLTNEDDQHRNVLDNLREKGSNNHRRPRVKSNIMARLQNNPSLGDRGDRHSSGGHVDNDITDQEFVTTTETTVKPVLRIVPDGRSPRVKSNILNKSSNRKHHQKKKFKGAGRRKFGRSLDLDRDSVNEIDDSSVESEVDFEDFDFDNDDNDDEGEEEYTEPEIKPDGRKARIKSNILAKKSMIGDNKQSGRRSGSRGSLAKAGKKHKNGKSGFRESKKVATPDTSFRTRDDDDNDTTPYPANLDNLIDGSDNAITTFRPVISLEQLMNSNETLPHLSSHEEVSVPLPNFEPSFSDMTNSSDSQRHREKLQPSQLLPQSVTEIVRVSSKDQNLFNSDYSYYDYYDEFFNS